MSLKIDSYIFTYSHLPFSGDFRYLINEQSNFKKKFFIQGGP